ncbi:unnamed protein product [Paramecium primaurelia]|uniref:Thioredoxin-like fold n=1 Tax=Paramecium primaurelia TaxID=5886 RepID=A0A8S1NAZ5_PARPR|nr:unnamed protein product [Paramecium primaurelia]
MKNKQKSKFGQQLIASLPSYLNILEITNYIAQKEQDQIQIITAYKSRNRLKAADSELYQSIIEKLEYSKKDLDANEFELMAQFLNEIQPKYEIGDQIKKISDIEQIISSNNNLNFQTQKVTLQIQKEFIYVINIWDTIVLGYNGPIDEVVQLHQMKTEWHGTVKLIAISLKSTTEEIIELVTLKKWQYLDHYKLIKNKINNHQFLNMLNIEGLPFALVIGKNGKIIHAGYHYEVALDDLITQEMLRKDEDAPQLEELKISNNDEIFLDNKIINELQAKNQEQNMVGQKQSNDNRVLNISQQNKSNEDKNYEKFKESKLQNANSMIKVQLKVLKQYLLDIQKVLKNLHFQSKFQIVLRRQRRLRFDGCLMIEQISDLELEYQITYQEMEMLDYFMEQVWNKIPEHLRIVKVSNLYSRSDIIKNIISVAFAKHKVSIKYQQIMKKSLIWDSNSQEMIINNSEGYTVQSSGLNLENFYEGIQKAKLSIEELRKDFDYCVEINEVIEKLQSNTTLGRGKKFAPILNYKNFGSSKKESISHIKGQVLVILYWQCNKDCIVQLRNIDELIIKNNESWGKIVKFVALNIGNEKEYISFLEQNKEHQSRLQIYNKERAHLTDTSLYAITQVPYFILVDKFGFIRYIQSPINLERSIQQLVKENERDTYQKNLKAPIQQQSVDLIKRIISSNNFKTQLLSIDQNRVIEFRLDFEVQQDDKAKNAYQNIYLNYFIRDKQEEEFNQLLDKIFSIIPEDRWIIRKQIQQTVSIQYPGNKCVVCSKDISKEPKQYYCYFKKEHVCVECAEFTDLSQKGMYMYKYQDTLIFINGPLHDESVLHDIDSHKIGKNRQLQKGQKASQKHDFVCDGCVISSEGPRYIAVNARPGNYKKDGYIDYCKNCFQILKNKGSSEAKNIVAKNSHQGMTADSIFTRVLFNYGKYRDF